MIRCGGASNGIYDYFGVSVVGGKRTLRKK